MKIELLKNYINKLTKEDIIKYIEKEKIKYNDNEINIIYNSIKNDYEEILNSNIENYISKHNISLNKELYNKIIEKFNYYKKFIA